MSGGLERLESIKSFSSLVEYLRDELGWNFETEEVEDLTYADDAINLNLNAATARKIHTITQLRPLVDGQPWGIFHLDFAGQMLSVALLRGILRGLVARKRASANQSEMRKWRVENLLFICTSNDFQSFNFAYFRGAEINRAVLSTFGWQHGDTHLRTLAQYNLPALRFPSDTSDAEGWLKKWREAFDVEALTDKFFADYHKVFKGVEEEVNASIKNEEAARLYTQRLFNRLMFLYFIQKKGWLEFEGSSNYLRALLNAAEREKENFLRDRLRWLFFYGMSEAGQQQSDPQKHEFLEKRRGHVPYLNGGLFDIEDDDDLALSAGEKIQAADVDISNDAFNQVLAMFERYNFTVEESTPLNVQVAVDPEMLGKVFEELVTGRHESGSYYTPREIVSFMCREALKHYLAKFAGAEAAARFVDEGDASGLANPESVLDALQRVRVCDPACGSGAYLLGMMQELLRLRGALFVSKQVDDKSVYERKRSIIESNLYGVDKDKFAVQIACLRLLLSMAIDSNEPQPLPNLDFKIRQGDSLMAPARGNAQMNAWDDVEKQEAETGFDWAVEFAEVFVPPVRKDLRMNDAFVFLKDYDRQGTMLEQEMTKEGGGFDIILANPPYGILNKRQNKRESIMVAPSEIEHFKKSAEYLPAAGGMLNIFRLFVVRSIRLLKPAGVMSNIFPLAFTGDISASNLRKHILENHQIIGLEAFPERDNENKRVFKAVKMSVCILTLSKSRAQENFYVRLNDDRFVDTGKERAIINKSLIQKIDRLHFTIPLVQSADLALLEKIYSQSSPLARIGHCFTGEIDLTFGKKYLTDNPQDAVLIKGAIVDRYAIRSRMSQGEIKYLNVNKYLSENAGKKSTHHLYPRIVMQGITGVNEKVRLKMALIEKNIFCANSVNYIIIENSGINFKYLLALLNSKLMNYVFSKRSTNSNVNGYEVDNLPIIETNHKTQGRLASLVDQILLSKKNQPDADTSPIESKIDEYIYRLFNLSQEEIELIIYAKASQNKSRFA